MPHVMTVLGPVDPSTLGFPLPDQHTQCTLWHIQDRWDYWELTPDEPVILQELRLLQGGRRDLHRGRHAARDRPRPRVAPADLGAEPLAHRHGRGLVPHGVLPA